MSVRRLPRLPMFLLTRFAVGTRHDSLVGDLIEQFQNGRSRGWLWRQTLSAVVVMLTCELRSHKWIATRAVVAGWIVFAGAAMVANRLTIAARGRLIAYVANTGTYSPDTLFWSSHIPSIGLSYLACAICGWVIARFHRKTPSVFVLFAASVFIVEYGFAAFMLSRTSRTIEMPPGGWVVFTALIGRPMALFVGGLAGLKARATGAPSRA